MKRRSAAASRLTTCTMVVDTATTLNAGPVDAASDYPPVTCDRLTRAPSDPGWLTDSRSYNGQSHSPLKQSDASNVGQLKQAWRYPFPAKLSQSFEATPIVNGNYLFVSTPKDNVYVFGLVRG
ncbi:hypothetical protein C7402_13511 [Paraburkholderia unamae]|uniref:Pyrrolo-quinoline quinone repeat domain-containing protein n=1 Tax=Paraburkholderia unamae TaxID=219649 RepID=A0ABX5K845_9BURK|nr:hypothetical protein C7402_13511 [Paraburkholderia unamae]